MKLEELKVYTMSMKIGEEVWNIVIKWNYFEQDTNGKQLVRAIDSVAANLSEGFGRYHYLETKHFGYYSRGSLYESKTWLKKANNRKMIPNEQFEDLTKTIEIIGKMLNKYIKSIGPKPTIN
jgi:four helix bundle protein